MVLMVLTQLLELVLQWELELEVQSAKELVLEWDMGHIERNRLQREMARSDTQHRYHSQTWLFPSSILSNRLVSNLLHTFHYLQAPPLYSI
jgi:hypothetical protein